MKTNYLLLISALIFFTGCKDPREKTIWDYIDGEVATDAQYQSAIEDLHQELIESGYMKNHSCIQLDCYSNHMNTYSDIERVNSIVE